MDDDFLNEEELALLRRLKNHPKLTTAGYVIDVDVGIVTGLNEFFVLTREQVEKHALMPYTQRIVGRSAQLPGIRFSEEDWLANVEKQSPAFLNSLTFAFSEVIGRSYGGGVLELEPNEAEKLPLPLIGADMLNLEELDTLLRENNISTALDITDRVLLQEGLGLSSEETTMLRAIWQKLRDRRINRKPDSALKRV